MALSVVNCLIILLPSQNTNVYHMVVECLQMFANIKHSITVFNEHWFDVSEDSSKCEKRLCLTGYRLQLRLISVLYHKKPFKNCQQPINKQVQLFPKTLVIAFDCHTPWRNDLVLFRWSRCRIAQNTICTHSRSWCERGFSE